MKLNRGIFHVIEIVYFLNVWFCALYLRDATSIPRVSTRDIDDLRYIFATAVYFVRVCAATVRLCRKSYVSRRCYSRKDSYDAHRKIVLAICNS